MRHKINRNTHVKMSAQKTNNMKNLGRISPNAQMPLHPVWIFSNWKYAFEPQNKDLKEKNHKLQQRIREDTKKHLDDLKKKGFKENKYMSDAQ